jgi:hypothetical protein
VIAGFVAYAIQQLPGGDAIVPISHVVAVLLALFVGD